MPTPRASKPPAAEIPPLEDIFENGDIPPAPRGSDRAARRRAEREQVKAEPDPIAQARLEYQQLAAQIGDVMRDKAIAQHAAEMANMLLNEARSRLTVQDQTIQVLIERGQMLQVELDALYDEHPELAGDDQLAVVD